MEDLAERKCLACDGGQPPLTSEEVSSLIPGLNEGWEVVEIHHLQKEWSFPDFSSALEFVNLAGGICEDEGHHADFEVGWGRVKAAIWTHKINGLTESDFFLAAKFDRIER